MNAKFWLAPVIAGLNLLGEQGKAAELLHWNIDGVEREALVVAPASRTDTKPPLLFVFHGHGGNMYLAERGQAFHESWPEAVVVYAQGLPTPGYLHDEAGRLAGWQHQAGERNNRDLRFVDAIIATLRRTHSIDENRIYATGFSNGGFFCYLLWAERPQVFAAVAPGAAQLVPSIRLPKPKPVFIYGGRNDRLVRFGDQQAALDAALKVNGCTSKALSCGDSCMLYVSDRQAPVMTFLHEGGHLFVPSAKALIVQFFKEHPRLGSSE